MSDLNWFWIGFELLVPSLLGLLAAYPVWVRGEPIFGNLVGTAVIFAAAIGTPSSASAWTQIAWHKRTNAGSSAHQSGALRATVYAS